VIVNLFQAASEPARNPAAVSAELPGCQAVQHGNMGHPALTNISPSTTTRTRTNDGYISTASCLRLTVLVSGWQLYIPALSDPTPLVP
jgi:hypothetical protein